MGVKTYAVVSQNSIVLNIILNDVEDVVSEWAPPLGTSIVEVTARSKNPHIGLALTRGVFEQPAPNTRTSEQGSEE
jgi:hypothetical protein